MKSPFFLNIGQIQPHYKEVSVMRSTTVRTEVIRNGISFGTALAIAISWSANHSVLWAIVHGLLSWFYVIYHVLFKS
jgi:hypothetical protein